MSGSKEGKLFVMNMTLEADPDNPSETKVIFKHGWNDQVLDGIEKQDGAKKRKIKDLDSSEESECEVCSDESDGESSVSDSEYYVLGDPLATKAYRSQPRRLPPPPRNWADNFKVMSDQGCFPKDWKDHMAPLMHLLSIRKCGICNKKLGLPLQIARKHYHSRLHIQKHVEAIDRVGVLEELKISKIMEEKLRALPKYIPLDREKYFGSHN